jgi:hypothetical protein
VFVLGLLAILVELGFELVDFIAQAFQSPLHAKDARVDAGRTGRLAGGDGFRARRGSRISDGYSAC